MNMEQIVAACQRKEPDAQRLLYDEYASRMLGVCMRYTHSRDEAQDLLHDGFIKVFEKIGQLQSAQSLEGWMYKIMVHESVNYVTRNKNVTYYDIDQMEEQCDFSSRMDDDVLDTDAHSVERVLAAIRELPDLYRLAFNLREVDELTYTQIASELNRPEGTVRSLVFRAKQMLRNKLQNIEI